MICNILIKFIIINNSKDSLNGPLLFSSFPRNEQPVRIKGVEIHVDLN